MDVKVSYSIQRRLARVGPLEPIKVLRIFNPSISVFAPARIFPPGLRGTV